MSAYVVTDIDVDCCALVEAVDPLAAALRAIDDWGMEAEPGTRISVFAVSDATVFEFANTLREVTA